MYSMYLKFSRTPTGKVVKAQLSSFNVFSLGMWVTAPDSWCRTLFMFMFKNDKVFKLVRPIKVLLSIRIISGRSSLMYLFAESSFSDCNTR